MNFTFCAIDLGITEEDRKILLKEVLSIPKNLWHVDSFRGTKCSWIYNGGAGTGFHEVDNTKKFGFAESIKYLPELKTLLEGLVFPFMSPPGRVIVLDTPKDVPLNVHLDSKEEEIGSRQHKFRISLSGNIDKLYFLDENYKKVFIPKDYCSYVMDGSHAHSIDGGEQKVTLCIGSPWKGQDNDIYEYMVESSPYKMNVTRPKTLKEWVDPRYDKKNR